jgi:hypothetical protein
LKRLILGRCLVPDHPRQQTRGRVYDRASRDFPARQHKIAQAYDLIDQAFDPGVDSLVMAAHHDEMPLIRVPNGIGLTKSCSRRTGEQDATRGGPRGRQRRSDHIDPHDHARPAAKWGIIDRFMPIGGKVANVPHLDLDEAGVLRPPDDGPG